MTKRIISIVTAILMMLQIMMIFPIELSAETPPQTTTYTGTGYTVEYTVKSSWDKTQNIGIKLNNTSDSPMSVWALKYNAHGEIRELYNGEVYKNEGAEYIIRSTSSNSSIEAGKSVEFGYSVTGENLSVPESIVLCSEQREANEAEYSVEFQLSEQWNPTYTAKIVLNNLSQFEMSGWSLSYDSNATVENIWNGKLISQNNGRITVSGSAENFTLPTGGTTEININGNVSDESPAAENFKLSYTYINADIEDDNNGEEKEDLVIFAFGNYDEETDNLEVSWYSNTEKGTYEVLKSEDNISYTAIASVTDTDSCSVAGTSLNNGTQYFKVKVTDENGRTAESIPFEVTKNENGVTSEYIDTDKDGLADYLEETLGTDPDKADTDNDELTDYDEIYITGTDPLKADTDGNGRLDSKEDPDNDGLNNIQEIGLKTDPLNPDTDGDGLTDGAEANTHWTLPTKYDTDDDGIGDGDEIKIGLNPKNPKTYGMPDTEYTIPQEVTADSEAMSEINTEDNPYELSVEVKAAGNAENISVSESGYANAMHNDAILGIIPELSYDSNCKVDEVVVKFKLEDEYLPNPDSDYAKISPEFEGIKRYNVFRFFEDINMLLPVETKFNVAENTLYAETDCLGTYCVMDMEKLLESLGISAFEEAELPVPMTAANAETTNNAILPSADKNAEFSVAFVVDTRSCVAPTDFATIKANILSVCKVLLTNSPNAEVYLLSQYGYKLDNGCEFLQNENGEITLKDAEEIETILNNLEQETITSTNKCILSEAVQKIYETTDHSKMTYVFDFFQPTSVMFRKNNGYATLEQLKANNIDVSVVSYIPEHKQQGYANDLYKFTNGIKIYEYEKCGTRILDHIYGRIETTYTIFSAVNLEPVILKAPVTRDYLDKAKELKDNPDKRGDYSNYVDTDDDGLYDFEEVDCISGRITEFNENGNAIMPRYGDCIETSGEFYVVEGLQRYKDRNYPNIPARVIDIFMWKIRVLPILSDPTAVDGDMDGLLDGKPVFDNDKTVMIAPKDPNPLKHDGPNGLWATHVKTAKDDVPTNMDKWYGNEQTIDDEFVKKLYNGLPKQNKDKILEYAEQLNQNVINTEYVLDKINVDTYIDIADENSGIEGFGATWAELNSLLDEKITEFENSDCKEKINKFGSALFSGDFDDARLLLHQVFEEIDKCIPDTEEADEIKASLGSRALNFKMDYNGIVHSQPRSWQAIGGYCNLYDWAFSIGTNDNMRAEKFAFRVDNMEYILWMWRGDYLNLGAGSEIGIYVRPDWMTQNPDKLDFYFVDYELSLPMQLYLYNYNSSQNIDNVLSWRPKDKQWWVTGFNPEYVGKVDVKKQVMVGCVDFSGYSDMYDALKNNVKYNKNENLKKYLIFDDDNHTVWLCWYEVN